MNAELALIAEDRKRAATARTGTVRPKEILRLQLIAFLLISDLLAVGLAFIIAGAVRLQHPFGEQVVNMLTVCLPVYVLLANGRGAFSSDVLCNVRTSISRAAASAAIAILVVLGIAYTLRISSELSRLMMAIGLLTSLILLALSRYIFGTLTSRVLAGRAGSDVVILDGTDLPGCWERDAATILHADAAGLQPSNADPVMLDRLGRIAHHHDRIIIACPPERRPAWALAMKGAGVDVEVLAPEFDAIGTLRVGRYESRTTAVVACRPMGLRDRVTKRLFDLGVVVPLLPILAPFLLLVALAIKLESRGPILFVQNRVGRGNRLFPMYKFRTMKVEQLDAAGARSTRRDDERITRIGRFLRHTSIDELPQLLNVLKGDMSIAGPRPHAIASTAEDKLFWEVDARYFNRHAVKPGLTGLAQVRGYRGATVTSSDLTNRVQADLEYLVGWTIWRDIAIVARTFRVLVHRNAY